MTKKANPGAAVTSQVIASLAARTALETPGVLRLESTLKDVLSRPGPTIMNPPPDLSSDLDGCRHERVWATLNAGIAHVHLEIATDSAYTALTVSDAVRERVRLSICNTGVKAGTIDISILAIESQATEG